jgi:hypothetical protein
LSENKSFSVNDSPKYKVSQFTGNASWKLKLIEGFSVSISFSFLQEENTEMIRISRTTDLYTFIAGVNF